MQNYKKYAIPPAQLIIADVPYNVGKNFYGSNPMWYNGGDNKNGESKLAGKAAFNSDFNFNLYEYFHFCSKMLKKEDKNSVTRGRSSNSPCMIVFCSFEQMPTLIDAAYKHGFGKDRLTRVEEYMNELLLSYQQDKTTVREWSRALLTEAGVIMEPPVDPLTQTAGSIMTG